MTSDLIDQRLVKNLLSIALPLLFSLSSLASDFYQGPGTEDFPLQGYVEIFPDPLQVGEPARLRVHLRLLDHYWVYSESLEIHIESPFNKQVSRFSISPEVEFFDTISQSDKMGIQGESILESEIVIPWRSRQGRQDLDVRIVYQACTTEFCLFPQDLHLQSQIEVQAGSGWRAFFSLQRLSAGIQSLFAPPSASGESPFDEGSLWIFLFVFLAGILTSFTPCIFPMIPITVAVLGQGAQARGRRENFLRSLLYVKGIALTYALLGVVAASTGALFGAMMSHPAVLGFIALMMTLMAAAMFGIIEVRAPQAIQDRLGKWGSLGGRSGAFLAGLSAGILASPCVGPVLVGILTHVATTQNLAYGFVLLFVFALGLGQVFIVLGLSTQLLRFLPKSGPWMLVIKSLFGIALLLFGAYYARLAVNQVRSSQFEVQRMQLEEWKPYSHELLAQATEEGFPVVIDFTADWCLVCLELERNTFSDSRVRAEAANFYYLKFDASRRTPLFDELRERYRVIGLPTLIFISSSGEVLSDLTLTGFENADRFLERLERVKAAD